MKLLMMIFCTLLVGCKNEYQECQDNCGVLKAQILTDNACYCANEDGWKKYKGPQK